MAKKKTPGTRKAAKKTAKKAGRKAECRIHEGDDAVGGSRRRHRLDPDAAHGSHQEDLGLHQEEQAAGFDQPAPHQCGRKLRAVFGGKGKVSMFEMTKLVSNHLK